MICDPTLSPGKNSPNITNSNRVLTRKGEGDKDFILTYLNIPTAEVFPHYYLSFSILAIFREKRVVKVGLIFFKQNFCLLEYYLWWNFWQCWTLFGEVKTKNPPRKGLFIDAEWVRKTLKAFSLTTTAAILMKFTTCMHLHESVSQKPLRASNWVFCCHVY